MFKYVPPSLTISPRERNYLWAIEIIWWLISLVLLAAVILPIVSEVEDYPFLVLNVVYVILFFHYARHVVFLKYSALRMFFWGKLILALVTIPLLFLVVGQFGYFQTFMDEHTMSEIMPNLSYQKQVSLNNFIKFQMVFFFTATVISGTLFVLRMMVSLWRQVNEKGF